RVDGRWPDTCGCCEERTAKAPLTTSRKCVTQPARTKIEPWIGSTGCDASLCRSPHATPPKSRLPGNERNQPPRHSATQPYRTPGERPSESVADLGPDWFAHSAEESTQS